MNPCRVAWAAMKAGCIVAGTVGTAIVGAVVTGAMAGAAATARPVTAPNLPPPRFGRTLDIGLVSGVVVVTPPGRRPFRLGVQDRNIPIASLIDTTHGRVDLRAAPPASPAGAAAARVERAQFYDGALRVSQSRPNSFTKIRLAGDSFVSCAAPSRDAFRPDCPTESSVCCTRAPRADSRPTVDMRGHRARTGLADRGLLRRHLGAGDAGSGRRREPGHGCRRDRSRGP